jgi:phage shock protein E
MPRPIRRPALALALALTLAACGDDKSQAGLPASTTAAPAATIPAAPIIDTARAHELVAAGALVIDVREQSEWDAGHLPQARLIPAGTIGEHIAELAQAAGGKDRPIVLYCKTGGRAGRAKQALQAAGFTDVVNGGSYRAMSAPQP